LYTPLKPPEGWMATRGTATQANRLVAADPWDGRPSRQHHFLSLLRMRCPRAEIRDLSPILDGLRALKSPREVDLLRRAGRLTAIAVTEAMRATAPGMVEYQLGAIAEYVYRLHGARGEGYRPIIASGPNAWHGHYWRNNRVMADGDLVLMDVAPDLGYYTSDIGRMWPVNGTYSPRQRQLYGFMVAYHKALLALLGPGKTAEGILETAAAEMAKVVDATAWSKPVYEQAARNALEFKGHLSHPVGMAVHDDGRYRDAPLRPGVVLSVDPQLRVPEEKLYIRCEDTVAITDDGIENLTAAAPLDLDAVEATMAEDSPFPMSWD
ncbi:MAG: M24 family metallopeptidase, partial [Planctomycetota bacterium]